MPVDEVGGRRRGGALVATLVALACALAAAPASAAEFVVNSTADKAAAVPGINCAEGEIEECTLRAAIEEANSLEEFARIDFEEETFEGQAAATIVLGSSLPTVTVPVFINGRTCATAAGFSGPCVGIEAPSGEPALVLDGSEESEVWGLALAGAQTAISLKGSPLTKIQASWFGVGLDGVLDGNGTGVLVGPGSNGSFVGGEGVNERNVFVDSAGDGLDIHGAADVKVFGNYFGVEPDGATPSANGGDDIEVASTEGLEASGTAIGTRVSPVAAASSQCDGGCNVISGAVANGVDLEGDGESETPAASTVIAGNYVGLGADGGVVVPNADAGIRVGEAAHTVVGGPSGGEANRVNGGSAGVLAGPAAPDLAVRGNLIGTDANGTGTLAPPDNGIVVDSAELASPAVEAEIVGNTLRMEGGIAISQQGQGAWIFANRIFGSQTGIRTSNSTASYGNVIEGNSIEGPAISGILVENDLNEIIGNSILGAGGAGIWIQGAAFKFGVSGNLVGGDTAEDENFIADGGGDAIEISNREKTANEVARNQGIANAGLFIHLVAASPGSEKTPSRGILPPMLSTATQNGAEGSAEPGAVVRVFRKQVAAAGELGSFLGEAIADEAGNWNVAYEEVPSGTIVAATQTSNGGTSELATATIAGGGSAGSGSTGGGKGGPVDSFRPRTKIVKGPKRRSRHPVARFAFLSDEVGATFQCQLDGRPFMPCTSPKRYGGLAPGEHFFRVRAIDRAGNLDATPAKKKFMVLG